MKKIFFILASIFSAVGFAADGGHHAEGIPTEVYYQALNVSIFLAILVWAGKDKVRALFQNRSDEFHRLARETERARAEMESKKVDIIQRMERLKKTGPQDLEEAKQSAEKFLNQEIEKAKGAADKVGRDANAQIAADQNKLFEKLRLEALEMAVADAEGQLRAIDAGDKSRMGKQFGARVEGAIL